MIKLVREIRFKCKREERYKYGKNQPGIKSVY